MTLAEDGRIGFGEKGQAPLLTGYAEDPYTWALEQASLLRNGRLDHIDAVNLADEIEALAHYLADGLRSDLGRVLQHLLKWDYQPDNRSRSWVLSIDEHRKRVARHLRNGSGLKSIVPELLVEAYENGRRHALDETGLARKALPEVCPYTWDEIMSRPVEWSDTP